MTPENQAELAKLDPESAAVLRQWLITCGENHCDIGLSEAQGDRAKYEIISGQSSVAQTVAELCNVTLLDGWAIT